MSPAPNSIGAARIRAFRNDLLGTVSLDAMVVGMNTQFLKPTYSTWMHPDTGEFSIKPIWVWEDGSIFHRA